MSKYRITEKNGIDEKIYIPINGQNQYIFIRGKNISNPFILYLHGGPAGPDTCLTYEFVNELSARYNFVMWDQRGCGRTFYENRLIDKNNESATFEQAILDVNGLVQYLCERFHKNTIIIMGHSYGSLLGVHYISRYPEHTECFIGVGQNVSIMGTQEANYNEVLKLMQADKIDTKDVTQCYKEFKTNTNAVNLIHFQRKTMLFYAKQLQNIEQKNQVKLMMHSPDISWRDIRWVINMINIRKHYKCNRKLFDYTMQSGINDMIYQFEVPVLFISGQFDKNCNVGLLTEYYQRIEAPKKEMRIIENCGHSPHVDAPERFAGVLIEAIQCNRNNHRIMKTSLVN